MLMGEYGFDGFGLVGVGFDLGGRSWNYWFWLGLRGFN